MELLAWRLSAFLSASAGHSELGILARSLRAGLSTAIAPPDAIHSSQILLRSQAVYCSDLPDGGLQRAKPWCRNRFMLSIYAKML